MSSTVAMLGAAIIMISLFPGHGGAQDKPVVHPLRLALQSGNPFAVWEAVRSSADRRDTTAIPDLRALLKPPLRNRFKIVGETEIALAILGDEQMLREITCRVKTTIVLKKHAAIEDYLPKIGGWFSVKLLLDQFDGDAAWEKAKGKDLEGIPRDVIMIPPSLLVLLTLPKILPEAHIDPPTPFEVQARLPRNKEKVAAWKEWIHDHEASLRDMEPTGRNADFSRATCNSSTYRAKVRAWKPSL